jgi:hypothetical protein
LVLATAEALLETGDGRQRQAAGALPAADAPQTIAANVDPRSDMTGVSVPP